ncbi:MULTISPECIES: fibronectin type III domain-containing protein [unclassified Fibrobacter]|uniref:fibronectin type III domain-containing protein n=1 Tax=unclassified Fibrobacter TaxID=2634177 RepID=UPI000921BC8D|nr:MULTISPECIES: fibronectin type III domain-containing protein [unclassified Fibrobacter]OWV07653.1 hypothetical protein B7993_02085 [Fibrobacter sp. UWH3]SHK56308.1 hypothetical protein SAMN05720765_103144 [Fibrobacter sp. UWH6]
MDFKKFFGRSLVGFTALTTAFALVACGDSNKTSNGDDEDEETEYSSSSSKTKGSSGSKDVDLSEKLDNDVNQGDLLESSALKKPTNLSVSRLAPSVFRLDWASPETLGGIEAYVLQRLAPTETEWKDVGTLKDPTATHFIIDGKNNADFYYRLAAMKGEERSAYSDKIMIPSSAKYVSDLEFPTVPSLVANIERDSVLEIVVTGNYPSQAILNSIYNLEKGEKTGEVYYEARFVYGSSYDVDTTDFSLDKGAVSKKFKSIEDECNSFAQVRVVWRDKNGAVDFSDWTSPIGTKTGTTTGLVGNLSELCAEVVVTESGFPAPANLAVNEVAGSKVLSWTYAPNEEHPASRFFVEYQDLAQKKWVVIDSVDASITRYLLESISAEISYYRVVAVDKKGEKSNYSEDIVVTSTSESVALGVPSITGVEDYSKDKLTLSWSYADNATRPVTGFEIQELDVSKNEWKKLGTVEASVNKFLLSVSNNVRYVRVVAYDANGRVPSADLTIPANATSIYLLPAPTIKGVTEMTDGKLALAWDYSASNDRPVEAFVVQRLNGQGSKLSSDMVDKKSRIFQIPSLDSVRYYRVGAYDSKDTSYSEIYLIPATEKPVLAAPANVAGVQVAAEDSARISWNYTDNAKRPARNFKVQVMNGVTWKDVGSCGSSVTTMKVALAKTGSYYRVGAYDAGADKDTVFSASIFVAYDASEVTLNAPTGFSAKDNGKNTLELKWSYTQGTLEAKSFAIDTSADGVSWSLYKSGIAANVTSLIVDAPRDPKYYAVVAINGNDSAMSEAAYVPGYVIDLSLPAPSGLKAERIAPSVWLLSWTYEREVDRREKGFIVESSVNGKGEWTEESETVDAGVLYYYANNATSGKDNNVEHYFHVAAYDDADTTAFTSAVQLTVATAYREDMKFTTPTVALQSPGKKLPTGTTHVEEVKDEETGAVTVIDVPDSACLITKAQVYVSNSFANRNIVNSEFTATTMYEVRWYTAKKNIPTLLDTMPENRLAIDYADANGALDPEDDPETFSLNDLYVQVRMIWTDKNGVSDYSEWSNPLLLSKCSAQ